jgi:hypothetical protein
VSIAKDRRGDAGRDSLILGVKIRHVDSCIKMPRDARAGRSRAYAGILAGSDGEASIDIDYRYGLISETLCQGT